MFGKKTPTPISLKAILQRIAEIDHKFKQTDPWLHCTLAKDARERELLVAKANELFHAGLKHEWR
jgi:hypothetical protein